MRTINVTVIVTPDGAVELEGAADLPPGKHHALLVVEQPASPTRPADAGAPLEMKMLDWSAWPAGSTYRREDLYGDDGR